MLEDVLLWLSIHGEGKVQNFPSPPSFPNLFSRYLASGGLDSIINMFDLNDWIVARTITVCE